MNESISLNWAKQIKAHGYQSGNKTASDVTTSRHWKEGKWKTITHRPGDMRDKEYQYVTMDEEYQRSANKVNRREKLNEDAVRFIRQNFGKISAYKLAKMFKVTDAAIKPCATGQSYRRFNKTIPPVKLRNG